MSCAGQGAAEASDCILITWLDESAGPQLFSLPPFPTGTLWPHKWDLTPLPPDKPVLSVPGQSLQHLPAKCLAQHQLAGLEATRKTTAKPRKSPKVLSPVLVPWGRASLQGTSQGNSKCPRQFPQRSFYEQMWAIQSCSVNDFW